MTGRRGFLGILLGTGVAVADPDVLKWKPGAVVYDIPKRVHVPEWHQMSARYELPDPSVFWLDGRGDDPTRRIMAAVGQRCMAAVRSVADMVDREIKAAGNPPVRFERLPGVHGLSAHSVCLELDFHVCLPAPPCTRLIESYCPINGQMYGRVDCLVRI
jgi:hypothetical protein